MHAVVVAHRRRVVVAEGIEDADCVGLLGQVRDLSVGGHMIASPAPGDDGLVFTSPRGMPLRHSQFRSRVWLPALRTADLPPVHFHDLRHTGNQLAADAGAGLWELMDRMGHSTTRAALLYLHGSDERQHAVADAMSELTKGALTGQRPRRSGTQRARRRRSAS